MRKRRRFRFSVLTFWVAIIAGGCAKPEAGPRFTKEELTEYLEKQEVEDDWRRLQRQVDRENALLERAK